jgi:alkylation response protein AidB-like acyl-CoA dehydrogenase
MQAATTALERARALHPLISGEALEGELAGRLTDRAAGALLDAGLFSILIARSDGGAEAGRAEFFEAVEAIAAADGSAGWCLAVCAVAAFVVSAAARPEARLEVFGDGPVALWTTLLEGARSTPAVGGYTVSGRFGWGSGSSFAGWVVVNEGFADNHGKPWFRAFVARKSDVDLDPDSWRSMGLEATASVDYAISDKFVPTHRVFEYPLGQTETAGAFSTVTSARLNQVGLTAFASGVGARALSEILGVAAKTRRLAGQETLAEDRLVQHGIGEHDGRLRAARAHYLGLLHAQDRHIAAQGVADAAIAWAAQQAAFTLTRAARDLTIFAFDSAPAKVVTRSDPIQRCLRDIFAGLKHATFSPALLARIGKARLAQPAPSTRVR